MSNNEMQKGKVIFSIPIKLDKFDKALKRELKTTEEYYEIAKSALKCADNYFDLANPDLTEYNPKLLANDAFFANCLFACELYTKSILYYCQQKFDRRHSLLDLYNLIPDVNIKSEIKSACENIKVIHICFDKEIKDISDGFEVLRYSYEYKGLAFRYHFIFLYELVLNNIAH